MHLLRSWDIQLLLITIPPFTASQAMMTVCCEFGPLPWRQRTQKSWWSPCVQPASIQTGSIPCLGQITKNGACIQVKESHRKGVRMGLFGHFGADLLRLICHKTALWWHLGQMTILFHYMLLGKKQQATNHGSVVYVTVVTAVKSWNLRM